EETPTAPQLSTELMLHVSCASGSAARVTASIDSTKEAVRLRQADSSMVPKIQASVCRICRRPGRVSVRFTRSSSGPIRANPTDQGPPRPPDAHPPSRRALRDPAPPPPSAELLRRNNSALGEKEGSLRRGRRGGRRVRPP